MQASMKIVYIFGEFWWYWRNNYAKESLNAASWLIH